MNVSSSAAAVPWERTAILSRNRDLIMGQARGYESRVLRLKNGIQAVRCVGVSSEASIIH